MNTSVKKGIILAITAALFYSINSPLSKIILDYLPPALTAGFLYIGAGVAMCFIALVRKLRTNEKKEEKLSKKEFPFIVAMILLDIAAPIFLMFGLKATTAYNAALLNNFEIVATAVIALAFFKEKIGLRLWIGIGFVTIACMFLSVEDVSAFKFSFGSLLILLACVCWGIENNCTRKISSKDPLQIVLLKGVFSGIGSIIVGLCIGEKITVLWSVFAAVGIGVVAYGLSIYLYVYAQRFIGAARTAAYYAFAPFIGTFLSLLIFGEMPNLYYFIGLAFMAVGAYFASNDNSIFFNRKISDKNINKK